MVGDVLAMTARCVVAFVRSPLSAYQFVTSSTDGSVALWDTRARRPLQMHRFPPVPPTLSPTVEQPAGAAPVPAQTVTGTPTTSQACAALVPNKAHCCCFEEAAAAGGDGSMTKKTIIGCGCDNGTLFLFGI